MDTSANVNKTVREVNGTGADTLGSMRGKEGSEGVREDMGATVSSNMIVRMMESRSVEACLTKRFGVPKGKPAGTSMGSTASVICSVSETACVYVSADMGVYNGATVGTGAGTGADVGDAEDKSTPGAGYSQSVSAF